VFERVSPTSLRVVRAKKKALRRPASRRTTRSRGREFPARARCQAPTRRLHHAFAVMVRRRARPSQTARARGRPRAGVPPATDATRADRITRRRSASNAAERSFCRRNRVIATLPSDIRPKGWRWRQPCTMSILSTVPRNRSCQLLSGVRQPALAAKQPGLGRQHSKNPTGVSHAVAS